MMFQKQCLLVLLAAGSIEGFLVAPNRPFLSLGDLNRSGNVNSVSSSPSSVTCSEMCRVRVRSSSVISSRLPFSAVQMSDEETEASEAGEEAELPVAGVDEITSVSEAGVEPEVKTEVEAGIEAEADETAAPAEPEESFTAYVVNLSYDTTNPDLREIFSEYGSVTKVYMPMDREAGRSKGFAFVSMSTREELNKVIENVNAIEVNGRKIYVTEAKPKEDRKPKEEGIKLYVGNISFDTTKETLIEYFSAYGTVRDVYVPTDRESGSPRGFAFVTMASDDAMKAIEEADKTELDGRTIAVNKSLPRGQKGPKRELRDEVKLYIGNLSFDTEEDSIRSLFDGYGPLIDVYLPIDRYTSRSRGFAFVTMSPENAARAIEETDGYEMDGRVLRVNEAQPKGYSPSNRNYGGESDWGADDDWQS